MPKSLVLAAVAVALGIAMPEPARCDTPGRARVTIRGTGNDVVLEQNQTPGRGPSRASPQSPGPFREAADLKARGASDAQVIAYLQAHQAEIPSIIDAEDVNRLKKAGAGKAVVTYLTTISAVEIGETGEGHEAAVTAESLPGEDLEAPSYPFYGYPDMGYGYGGGYGSRFPSRGGHHISGKHIQPLTRAVAPPRVVPVPHSGPSLPHAISPSPRQPMLP
jgi:hypothetical protein